MAAITKVLFVAANADDAVRLKLDREKNCVQDILKDQSRYALEHRGAIQSDELLDWLNRIQPTIFHFSGHGSSDAHLEFVERDDSASAVSAAALARAFRAAPPVPRVLILNACCSESMVDHLLKVVPCVIAMSAPISDGAAIAFTKGFYGALARAGSLDVGRAFRQGCAQIELEFPQSVEHEVPTLHGHPFPPADQARSYALNDDIAFRGTGSVSTPQSGAMIQGEFEQKLIEKLFNILSGAGLESFRAHWIRTAAERAVDSPHLSLAVAVRLIWSAGSAADRTSILADMAKKLLEDVSQTDPGRVAAIRAAISDALAVFVMSSMSADWLISHRAQAQHFISLSAGDQWTVDVITAALDDHFKLTFAGRGQGLTGTTTIDFTDGMEPGVSGDDAADCERAMVVLAGELWKRIYKEDPPSDLATNLEGRCMRLTEKLLEMEGVPRSLKFRQEQGRPEHMLTMKRVRSRFHELFVGVRLFQYRSPQGGVLPLLVSEDRLAAKIEKCLDVLDRYA